MKRFGFIKKAFFTGLTVLSSVILLNATPRKCISMNSQEFQVNVVVVVTISMIPMEKCVFLRLLKT